MKEVSHRRVPSHGAEDSPGEPGERRQDRAEDAAEAARRAGARGPSFTIKVATVAVVVGFLFVIAVVAPAVFRHGPGGHGANPPAIEGVDVEAVRQLQQNILVRANAKLFSPAAGAENHPDGKWRAAFFPEPMPMPPPQSTRRAVLHLSTDKPIYHEGDSVFLRAVVLDAFGHAPLPKGGRASVKIEVTSPKGSVAHSSTVSAEVESVAADAWQIPKGTVGGEYTVKATPASADIASAPPAFRKFSVRAFRPPRLNIEIELGRKGYAPGETATAVIRASRAEGGPCSGAQVVARATFGEGGSKTIETSLGAIGGTSISFTVPEQAGDDGTLSVTVMDGGVVESKAKTVPVILSQKSISMTFFPEGGDLIQGVPSRVYFEALDKNGDPVDITGAIHSVEDGEAVTKRITTAHEGRGVFELLPEPGKTYKLVLDTPTGVAPFSLPAPVAARGNSPGLATVSALKQVYESAEGVSVSVSIPPTTHDRTLLCGLFQKEKLITAAKAPFHASSNAQTVSVILRAPESVSGVLRVTVFDDANERGASVEHGVPIAERLVFRRPRASLNIHIKPDAQTYAPGGEVSLEVRTTDSEGKPVKATVGIAVTDNSVIEMIEHRKQAPRLPAMVFLENEVQHLEDCGSYLSGTSESARAVDLLLGTQGWRRFAYVDTTKFIEGSHDKALAVLAHNDAPIHEEFDMLAGGFRGAWKAAMPMMENDAAAPRPAKAAVDHQQQFEEVLEDAGAGQLPDGALEEEPPNEAEPARKIADAMWRPMPQRPVAVREYAYKPSPRHAAGQRSEFVETVLWNSTLVTDVNGFSRVRFHVSDLVTRFAISADGFSEAGLIGSGDAEIESKEPFYISPKVPVHAITGDTIVIPVSIVNDGSSSLDVEVTAAVKGGLALPRQTANLPPIRVAAGQRTRQVLEVNAVAAGHASISFSAKAGQWKDSATFSLEVSPRGFPIDIDHGGVLRCSPDGGAELVVDIPKDARDMNTSVKLYATPAANLMQALEALIREPYGCFEQASSTVYPMVMAMQYFDSHGISADAEPVKRARAQLEKGYKMLSGYEVKQDGGGFEWFGSSPPHEALTAYGLLEFVDMAKVYPVESQLIERAKRFLLGRRSESGDGGGFLRNPKALDSFGAAPEEITNAYIVWSLTFAGIQQGLEKQIAHLAKLGETSDDPYFVALVAGIHANIGQHDAAKALGRKVLRHQQKDGSVVNSETSITRSSGDSLVIETTSIAILSWLDFDEFSGAVEQAMTWLATRCKDGRFGTTQGTVLALKAIISYDIRRRAQSNKEFSIALSIDGAVVERLHNDPNKLGPLSFSDFSAHLTPGKHRIALGPLACKAGDEVKLPFSVHVRYFSEVPASSPDAQLSVGIQTTPAQLQKLKEGDTVGVTVTVKNLGSGSQGMAVAVVGLPGGFEARFDRLKELVASGQVDFFEIVGTEVVLYWRSMGPSQVRTATFDAIAKVPGRYSASASRAWLYYGDSGTRSWLAPITAEVAPIQ